MSTPCRTLSNPSIASCWGSVARRHSHQSLRYNASRPTGQEQFSAIWGRGRNPCRYRRAWASTSAKTNISSIRTRTKNAVYGTSLVIFLGFGYLYVTDTRAGIHQWVIVPSLRWMYEDAEEAHEAGNKALKSLHLLGLHPRERGNPDGKGDLEVEIFGHVLSNPIGTSAGIDKHAEIASPLLAIGPAVVEVGGATPYPQEGNPKPRVFRIPSQNALINRYGLNSEGAAFIAMRLRERVRQYSYAHGLGMDEDAEQLVLDGGAGVPPGSLTNGKLLAVQVAKNKSTPDEDIEAVKRDYVYCVDLLSKYADIIVVNVSSPNTPGLRTLQRVEPLTNILKGVVGAAKSTRRKSKPAVMVKISPDEDSDEEISGICDAVWESGVDGVIVGNTTNRRPDPLPKGFTLPAKEVQLLTEQGGYSGPQMFERTLALVKKYRKYLDEGPRISTPSRDMSATPAANDLSSSLEDTDRKASEIPTVPDDHPASPQSERPRAANPSPLFRLPERHKTEPFEPSAPSSSHAETPSPSSSTSSSSSSLLPEHRPLRSKSFSEEPKVIFATGGITNGHQALEVLNSGASLAMVYTALVFGGVGTISRIKEEMREELTAKKTS
ncbi:MAG: Dihydroorotate dehydrogenase (quinone), mitochondrial [Sclerophora amabilis]|nr:MAG: Dihydroorotate dehydrogenase (quinone), mitochondrial [Sclerophora amabilis]